MVRSALQAVFLAAIACAVSFSGDLQRVHAAQPPWTGDGQDVQRCTSTSGGPQNLAPGGAFVFFDTSGPGARVGGEYISFTCNFKFTRNGSGYTAGVAVIVDYCPDPNSGPSGPTEQSGNFSPDAGSFDFRLQQKILHQGALITITVFTNKHNNVLDFNLQEMISGSTNLADLNRPDAACGGGNNPGNWGITLATPDTTLIAGNDFVLTATANKSTAGTGFAIFIRNVTDGQSFICQNVTICNLTDFKNEPGSRVYQAFVSNPQGGNVQASSNQVTVAWEEWTGTVTLVPEDDEVNAGDVVDMTATANPTINATIYKIRIERQDGGHVPGECLESPCTKFDTYEFGVTHNYVAKVLRQDGTGLRATSPPVQVKWKATEEWNGTVDLRAAGGDTEVGVGTYVVVEATASPDLDGTDYVITITEQSPGGGGESFTCAEGSAERCTLVVKADSPTTRFFQAVVVKRDGTGTAKASSELVTVLWSLGGGNACEDGWRATSVTGQATVLIGGRVRVPLTPGQWICPKDAVETGANSTVVGSYQSRGMFQPGTNTIAGYDVKVEVKPSTQLALDFSTGDISSTSYTQINLLTGQGTFYVDGIARSDFRIKSPTGVASVRGTAFSVDVDPLTGHTYIEVYEGEVRVEPDNPDLDDVTLRPGDSVTVGFEDMTDVAKFYGALPHKRRLPALGRDGTN